MPLRCSGLEEGESVMTQVTVSTTFNKILQAQGKIVSLSALGLALLKGGKQ